MTIHRSLRSSSVTANTKPPPTYRNTHHILDRKISYIYLLNYELNIFAILSNKRIQGRCVSALYLQNSFAVIIEILTVGILRHTQT